VPDVSGKNYASEMCRDMFYVACLSAMRRLVLTRSRVLTRFIPA
jgi:hypothetical protein